MAKDCLTLLALLVGCTGLTHNQTPHTKARLSRVSNAFYLTSHSPSIVLRPRSSSGPRKQTSTPDSPKNMASGNRSLLIVNAYAMPISSEDESALIITHGSYRRRVGRRSHRPPAPSSSSTPPTASSSSAAAPCPDRGSWLPPPAAESAALRLPAALDV